MAGQCAGTPEPPRGKGNPAVPKSGFREAALNVNDAVPCFHGDRALDINERMKNSRIILTGASAGIGRALALEYARRGAQLLLVARRRPLLDELAGEVRELGGRCEILAADVADPGSAATAVAIAHEAFGGVDMVLLNAGRGGPMFVDAFDAEEAEMVMRVNYFGIVRMVEAILPYMLAEGRGTIAAVSSLAAYLGMPGSGAYNASKAAATILMESLRTELRPRGIDVITIAPGFVRTAMTAQNEFSMPFIMEPEAAAARIARAIDRRTSLYRFPLATSLTIRLLSALPHSLYDRIVMWGRSTMLRKR